MVLGSYPFVYMWDIWLERNHETFSPNHSRNSVVAAEETYTETSDSAMSLINGETAVDLKEESSFIVNTDQHQLKDALPNDLVDSPPANHSLKNDALVDTVKGSESELIEENDDYMYEDYGDEEDEDDDEDYEYDTELIDADCNFNLASKFDDMELPPGVEATVPWLVPSERDKPDCKLKGVKDENDIPYKDFKRFDIVEDFSDHHYVDPKEGSKSVPTTKEWTRRIQHEWKLLENDLPDTIFVRAYGDRMDLLRAVIIGPVGTPYHDGIFFFDAQFPPTYPAIPPMVYYHSGGLRLNPNLYNNGYVCLSLLGTWAGKGCEKWNPDRSTMLQVLVSIQALVLNDNPYFNEPGYEAMSNTQDGKRNSTKYNENTFVLSCRTMLYSLRRPPMHFEKFVAEHFRLRGRTILAACKAYMDGVQVGGDFKDEDEDEDEEADADADGNGNGNGSGSGSGSGSGNGNGNAESSRASFTTFTHSLEKLFEDLLMEFTVKGADCGKFLSQKVKAGLAAAKAAAEREAEIKVAAEAEASKRAAEASRRA